tara:strand:+ start:526 stop:678 length:153 start_codon:yes stop_codon:yes gene_type:complete
MVHELQDPFSKFEDCPERADEVQPAIVFIGISGVETANNCLAGYLMLLRD